MPLLCHDASRKSAPAELALGLGVHHLRGSAVPMLAKAAGFDWLFIDPEHGFISTPEIARSASRAAGAGAVVRICSGAFDEGTRALDNGALGLVVPHVDTPEQARALVDAFRFAPLGHRSTGGPTRSSAIVRPPRPRRRKF